MLKTRGASTPLQRASSCSRALTCCNRLCTPQRRKKERLIYGRSNASSALTWLSTAAAPCCNGRTTATGRFITTDDRKLINDVLDSGILAGGTAPQVAALEREWAAYTGSKYCLTTCSGTAALHMSLAACGVGPGDEIITSAFTFLASASCALHQNADSGLCRY